LPYLTESQPIEDCSVPRNDAVGETALAGTTVTTLLCMLLCVKLCIAGHVIITNKDNMKKIIITTAIFISLLSVKAANAQVSLNINIGSQPEWGPVGYDHADYYYMPDIDT
jgi:hypothetical protein